MQVSTASGKSRLLKLIIFLNYGVRTQKHHCHKTNSWPKHTATASRQVNIALWHFEPSTTNIQAHPSPPKSISLGDTPQTLWGPAEELKRNCVTRILIKTHWQSKIVPRQQYGFSEFSPRLPTTGFLCVYLQKPPARGKRWWTQDGRRHLSAPAEVEVRRAWFARCPGKSRCRGPAGAPGSGAGGRGWELRRSHHCSNSPTSWAPGTRGEGKDGTAPHQRIAASRCRYLLMKPSPSPSQVWKRRLILSSSPVLEVSVLLLSALHTSATAAAAIMRPTPEEEEAGGERRRRQGCLGSPGFPVPQLLQSASGSTKPRRGALPARHSPPAEWHPGRDPAGARSGDEDCWGSELPPEGGVARRQDHGGIHRQRTGAVAAPGPAAFSTGSRRVRGDPNPPRVSLVLLEPGRPGSLLRGRCFGCGRSVEANKPQRFSVAPCLHSRLFNGVLVR